MTRLGYPMADLAMMEVIGIDHLVDALHEEEMRLRFTGHVCVVFS